MSPNISYKTIVKFFFIFFRFLFKFMVLFLKCKQHMYIVQCNTNTFITFLLTITGFWQTFSESIAIVSSFWALSKMNKLWHLLIISLLNDISVFLSPNLTCTCFIPEQSFAQKGANFGSLIA